MPNQKRHLTIDTWVIEKASSKGGSVEDDGIAMKSVELLSKIYNECHSLVLDYNDAILEEYRAHAKEFAMKWLTLMGRRESKVVARPRIAIHLKIKFDPDDMKFLETAMSDPDKLIVTGDSDFLDVRDKAEVKNLGIKIMTVDEALTYLDP